MVVPLVCLYALRFQPQVIAFWLLVTTFQSVVGGINGALPTLSMQMLSYAHAGSHSIFGTMDDHRLGRGDGPNHGLMAHINRALRSEEHTSELQSLMRISYAVFCLKKKKNKTTNRLKPNIKH